MTKRILVKPNEIVKIEQIQVKNCIVISLKDTNFFLAKTDGEDDGDQVASIHKTLYLTVANRISLRPSLP